MPNRERAAKSVSPDGAMIQGETRRGKIVFSQRALKNETGACIPVADQDD